MINAQRMQGLVISPSPRSGSDVSELTNANGHPESLILPLILIEIAPSAPNTRARIWPQGFHLHEPRSQLRVLDKLVNDPVWIELSDTSAKTPFRVSARGETGLTN